MTTLDDLSARMDRLEGALERVTALLETRLAPSIPAAAATDATTQLAAVHGADALAAHMSELVVQLGDPETLGSLTRLIALAPKLEYAAYLGAAGPELLEDALGTVQARMRALGLEAADVERRVQHTAEALTALTDDDTLALVRRFAGLAPTALPMAEAAASALRQRTAFEGADELQQRMEEALLNLSDPETQEALIRIACLAPQLEYAAYFAAAGPELLEEAMELARSKTAEHGLDPHVIAHRLSQATDLLIVYTGAEQLELLRQFGQRSPHLAPVLRASTDVLQHRADHEGRDALETRLYDALLEVTDPDTLAAITRLAALAPQLEYAAYFAAAGPELLEDLTASVRAWAADRGVAGIDRRLQAGVDALITLSHPATLKGLAGVSSILASVGETEGSSASLERMVGRLPRMERTINQVERALDMLDNAADDAGIGTIEDLEAPAIAGLKLLMTATDPPTIAALERVIALAPDLVRVAEPFMRQVASLDPDVLDRALHAAVAPETLELVTLLHDRAPSLRALLDAADLDPATIHVLRAANDATAAAVTAPSEPVGLLGLVGVLRDPDVQRALGFGVTLSKELSTRIGDTRRLAGK